MQGGGRQYGGGSGETCKNYLCSRFLFIAWSCYSYPNNCCRFRCRACTWFRFEFRYGIGRNSGVREFVVNKNGRSKGNNRPSIKYQHRKRQEDFSRTARHRGTVDSCGPDKTLRYNLGSISRVFRGNKLKFCRPHLTTHEASPTASHDPRSGLQPDRQ